MMVGFRPNFCVKTALIEGRPPALVHDLDDAIVAEVDD